MFHHPIYNKRQEIGKDVGGPSKPNHELSSLSSTNTAANCKYTFHVQSFNLLWKQVCGGVVSDAVDMVFAEFPPMNVCSKVSSTATCEPGNYNLWYCNNL